MLFSAQRRASEIPCSSLSDFCTERAQFTSCLPATKGTAPGSFLYGIRHKKRFCSWKKPSQYQFNSVCPDGWVDWHLCVFNDFYSFVKQGLGDNSVNDNSLRKGLPLSYFQSRGSAALTAAQLLLLRYWKDFTLNTWRLRIPLPHVRLERQKCVGFLYPSIWDVCLACLLQQSSLPQHLLTEPNFAYRHPPVQ